MNKLKMLSPQQKIQVLSSFVVFFCLFVYYFSLQPTFEAYTLYQKNQAAVSQAATAPLKIQQYQQQLAQTESSLSDKVYNRERLFEEVNTFCRENQLQLSHFLPEQRQQQQQYELITSPIVVQGDYANMVQLAYHLEYVKELGHIASSNFQTIKDRKTRTSYLEGTFHLQNVVKE